MFSPASTAPIYCPLYHEEYQQDYHNKEYGQDSQDCTQTPVTGYLIEQCHGQKTCNITANPQQLGAAVCNDHFVYLKTVYACVDMRAIMEEYVDRKHTQSSKVALVVTKSPVSPFSFETVAKISQISEETMITLNKTSEKINVEPRQVSELNDQFEEPATNNIFANENITYSLENNDEEMQMNKISTQ